MNRLPEPLDEERDRLRAEKLQRITGEVEAYWNAAAPAGALPTRPFTLADGVELLLYDLRRYQRAVSLVFKKEEEQEALFDHKTATGQDSGPDWQRLLAYRKLSRAITAVLSENSPHDAPPA